MPTPVTIATFNLENLFIRYSFKGKKFKDTQGKTRYKPYTKKQLADAVKDGFIIDKAMFNRTFEPVRKLTAKALKGVKADIVGLQEVESLDTLKKFNSNFMGSKKFKYQIVLDGNDNRFIDVALLSNYPIDFVRTHQFTKRGNSKVFPRDCLEAHININGKRLPVFINHFTSMMRGRANSRPRRELQSNEVIAILKDRFGNNYGDCDFVVLGDLNDYMVAGDEAASGIRALLQSDQIVNVVDRLPTADRWTHFYKGDKSYNQLDYILVSNSLANKTGNKMTKPVIERRGQPLRVNQKNKPKVVHKFFPEVKGRLKASDHCPVAVTLKV
jgi:predicted extracellular nuclease